MITPEKVIKHPDVQALIRAADQYMETIGYTDHSIDHVSRVAKRASEIMEKLEMSRRECELAEIAGYLHDIGNVIHRNGHPQASGLISFQLLTKMGMPMEEIAVVVGAIGNHDEEFGDPISNVSAALIIADKSDVRRSRVRNPNMINFDIHDRVNYAAEKSELVVDRANRLIRLMLKVDTSISAVAEYFEIFLSRMHITRRASAYLNCDFVLSINGVELM